MITFFQRWKVLNSLYRLGRERDMRVWISEHDLCAWISGTDMHTHIGGDSYFDRSCFRFWYFFFRVNNHDQLYQKIRNVIYDCEHIDPAWIRRTKGDNGISNHLCLSPRGNEVYGVSFLLFRNDYAKTIWTGIIVSLVIWYTTLRIEMTLPKEPQKIQIEYIYPKQ